MPSGRPLWQRPWTDREADPVVSPDEKQIAVFGPQDDLSLLEAWTGKEIRKFVETDRDVPIAFSHDGHVLATTSHRIFCIRLWDTKSAKQTKELKSEHAHGAKRALSRPTGNR
jgi:hypothetical protein